MFCALFRVSTRLAFFTAVTSVDSTGLWLAAVATGSVAMTWKLPGPLVGTAPQAEPNWLAASVLVVAGAAAAVWLVPGAELGVSLLPQAVRPAAAMVMLSAATIRVMRMVGSSRGWCCSRRPLVGEPDGYVVVSEPPWRRLGPERN